MPTEPIPFGNMQESGYEPLAGASPAAFNVVTDGKGAVRRRPGIATYDGAVTSVIDADGLAAVYNAQNGRLFAVAGFLSGRAIYSVTSSSATSLGTMAGVAGARPVIAETEARLVIAAGTRLQKVDFESLATAYLGGKNGDPPLSTHVTANASRLLAISREVNDRVEFSDVQLGPLEYDGAELLTIGHETWIEGKGDAGHISSETRPDPVLAIDANSAELFVWGKGTVQVFAPDPIDVYATVATTELGLAAAYSVVRVDETFAWLDHRRRIVLSDGRGYQYLSASIQQDLNDMASVSDCFGYRVVHGHIDMLVWTFPTVGVTYAYQRGGGWSQWTGYESATGIEGRFTVNCLHQRPGGGENVVGTTAGKIGVLKSSTQTDLGEAIRAHVVTGYLNRGTSAKKQHVSTRLALKRQTNTDTAGPQALLSMRDDEGPWQAPIAINLDTGQTVVELRSLGVYRHRQWRFQFSGPETLVLAEATEEFTVLGN